MKDTFTSRKSGHKKSEAERGAAEATESLFNIVAAKSTYNLLL